MSAVVQWVEHSLVLPFLGLGMRIDLFQSCGYCWVFQICWLIESNTLMVSSFTVLNSSTGIPLHPLALLTAVCPKAHLTSHSRMSGSGWLTTLTWLSAPLRPFLYSSSVDSCHLFLISSAFVRSLPFLSFIVPFFGHNVPFLEEVSSLSPSVVFLCFYALFIEKGHLNSPCYFLELSV